MRAEGAKTHSGTTHQPGPNLRGDCLACGKGSHPSPDPGTFCLNPLPAPAPTAVALHLSHHPSSSAGGLRGSPGRRLSSHGASRPLPLAFPLALKGFPGSRCPSGSWVPGRTLLRSNPAPPLSRDGGEAGVTRSHNFSVP